MSNSFGFGGTNACLVFDKIEEYRGNSLIRNCPPLSSTVGPWAYAYCRVLGGGSFL